MKLIRKNKTQDNESKDLDIEKPVFAPWKVLIVDDEPDIHAITRLNLRNFFFADKKLTFLEALSATEAKQVLKENQDIAVAFIDVVMEEEDAGLKLVEYIRDELKNHLIRLIIRTGQPGIAPERMVVDQYDIDDYKDKTELTAQKLYTTLRSALKSYRDLGTIDANRLGLKRILDAAADLYQPQSVSHFFQGVLTQMIGLCNLGENNLISTIQNGLVITATEERVVVQAGTGRFENIENNPEVKELIEHCSESILMGKPITQLPNNILPIALKVHDKMLGFICLENLSFLEKEDQNLVQIMANQCASALENLRLYVDLKEANLQALQMLAIAAEFKDKDTGDHINRLARYTQQLAEEIGLAKHEAENFSIASMLHDIGKIGIPDSILQKPAKLTSEEFDIIKTHPLVGVEILGSNKWFTTARHIAHGHHEKWDGTGYPQGLKAEAIPLEARIVAVADVFDALTHKRCYKSAWEIEESIAKIQEGAGSHFDPQVVDALMRLYQRGELEI